MTVDWWHPDLHGLVVLQGEELIFERYGEGEDYRLNEALGRVRFGPETLHDIRSVSKSVVGLLYGTALAEGAVPEPSASLMEQFPEYGDISGKDALRIEHALTMTLGLHWDESVPYTSIANSEIAMESAPDRYRFILEQPLVQEPGAGWHYTGGASALVGRIIEKGTGLPLEEYADARLFRPLGISSWEWSRGADGVVLAASGLRLAPRDLAAIGRFAMEAPLEPMIKREDGGSYGMQWYVGDGWRGAFGNGGQRLIVFPARNVVIVATAGLYNNDTATVDQLLWNTVIPAMT
ncbi:serine hydrolase domain-containing protein [Nonomuraea soli]|uniref:CubicO group peptidase (Beta-lactamase class C family) n=1 Tax=Nonomuraea soli TaxID=1032476 RepID=A0A7W0CIP7_9ACTN|nr:serine hydrolase domain-containing protein [Nonomuraea soli]MBA2891942.1 CubicO group peptidase (beta-lactamase class C family) [Nonomuraea soli]